MSKTNHGARALDAYMKRWEIDLALAAKRLGITRAHVSALRSGVSTPSMKLAWKIEKWTAGNVVMQTWVQS